MDQVDEKELVKLANELLDKLPGGRRVATLQDISASFFIILYEGLFAEPLPDAVTPIVSREDAVHNMQALIDTLSLDKLNTSLSHISGEGIVGRDPSAIYNLLQVFDWLYDYMLEKISEASSVADDKDLADDPDLVTPELIDDILSKELSRQTSEPSTSRYGNSTAELIALGLGSSTRDGSRNERTSELIALGDSRYGNSPARRGPRTVIKSPAENVSDKLTTSLLDHSKRRTPVSPVQQKDVNSTASESMVYPQPQTSTDAHYDHIGALPRDEKLAASLAVDDKDYRVTHHLYHHYEEGAKSLSSRFAESRTIDTQTTPSVQQTEKKDTTASPALSPRTSSNAGYERLHSLVEDTVSLSRAALDSSPLMPRRQLQPQQTNALPKQGILSPGKTGMSSSATDRGRRKVCFQTARSSDEARSTDTSTDLSATRSKRATASLRKHTNLGSYVPREVLKTQTVPRLLSTEDDSYHSDSCVDYGADSDDSGDFNRELQHYSNALQKRAKHVRFDDILDENASGRMGGVRRQILREEKSTRLKTEFLRDRYQEEVEDYETALHEELEKLEAAARTKQSEYKKKVLKKPKTKKYKPSSKYSVPNASSVLYPGRACPCRSRKRSASASPRVRIPSPSVEDELLPRLLEDFPYLHLSPETLHDMWRRSSRDIQQLSQSDQQVKNVKTKAKQQLEEAEEKHQLLIDIMKKEVAHNHKMRELDDRRRQQQAVRAAVRDKRQASARTRRYYEEYQVRMRARKLKKRTKEEQIFKQLFNDGLKIQKEKLRDVRRYAKEQRDVKAKKHKDQVSSMENYYRDQFAMLSDMLREERRDRNIRDKAQTKVVQQLQVALRRRMEDEVVGLQDQICRDTDDADWRQADADRLRRQLYTSRPSQAAV